MLHTMLPQLPPLLQSTAGVKLVMLHSIGCAEEVTSIKELQDL